MTKINKRVREHIPLQNFDLNANSEKFEECHLYDLIDVALRSGRLLFFGISYVVVPSQMNSLDFVVRNNRRFQTFIRILHIFFLLFILIPFCTEMFSLSPCSLINFIKKGLQVVLLFGMLIGYYCLEIKGRRVEDGMVGIYRHCILLQQKFKAVGLHFPSKTKVRAFGWTMSFLICLICMSRQLIFVLKYNPWYGKHSRIFSRTVSLGFWAPTNDTSQWKTSVEMVLGSLGILVDGLISNYWFYVQSVHFSLAVTMWMIFDKLNKGMKNGYFKASQMPEVLDLHFQSTKLLRLINQLISPLTFSLIVFDLVCLCFWTNYIALDLTVRPIYIAAVCFFVKTGVELILIADVNAKAHEITEWLEESCANTDKFPQMDVMKFTVFTSQIYSKESTGFRGFNLFVVTSHLVIAVAGIVITYTVAVNQVCSWQK